MVDPTKLSASKRVQQRTGRTFHLATRLLPRRVRHPTYVLYAFFRVADEVVDTDRQADPDAQRETLARFREAALGERATSDPVLSAFADIRERYEIPDAEVDAFIDAMAQDIDTDRYRTYEDLEGYMRGSSVAVANMMMAVMDTDDVETARPHARALAEAYQLTNFLRDVAEDSRKYGRIYVPQETLAAVGAAPESIERQESTPAVERAVRLELERAESLYRKGVEGIQYLPEDCQFGVLLSAVLYAEYHRPIRAQAYDVLSTEPDVSRWRQLSLVARTWFEWKLSRDPETVFERVSALPSGDTTTPEPRPTEPAPSV